MGVVIITILIFLFTSFFYVYWFIFISKKKLVFFLNSVPSVNEIAMNGNFYSSCEFINNPYRLMSSDATCRGYSSMSQYRTQLDLVQRSHDVGVYFSLYLSPARVSSIKKHGRTHRLCRQCSVDVTSRVCDVTRSSRWISWMLINRMCVRFSKVPGLRGGRIGLGDIFRTEMRSVQAGKDELQ